MVLLCIFLKDKKPYTQAKKGLQETTFFGISNHLKLDAQVTYLSEPLGQIRSYLSKPLRQIRAYLRDPMETINPRDALKLKISKRLM